MLQHYVPRFYLKYFSSHSEKSIGLYNIKTGKIVPHASLYPQGAEIDFYENSGRVEKELAEIESSSSKILREVLSSKSIPAEQSSEFRVLIIFILFQHSRTLGKSELMNEMSSKMIKDLMKTKAKLENNTEILKHMDRFSVDFNRVAILQMAAENSMFCLDLSYVLIENSSIKDFITSDNPVVFFNQFFQNREKIGGGCGIAQLGLQIYYPISPKLLILFYDDDTYNIQNKISNKVIINSISDIDFINSLQIANSTKNIFFYKNSDSLNIHGFFHKCKSMRRIQKTHVSSTIPKLNKDGRLSNYLISYEIGIKSATQLSFVKVKNEAKKRFNKSKVDIRRACLPLVASFKGASQKP